MWDVDRQVCVDSQISVRRVECIDREKMGARVIAEVAHVSSRQASRTAVWQGGKFKCMARGGSRAVAKQARRQEVRT